ncbi:unnamed protein product [Pieris macdunnoughi]|uniref:Uncharacterized protein n=1 Tax=Pieris macdunnoughi TaxID=345717 RepID=A0A821YA17_9NEOP|nr:unnamed protein product [Pieris macdunnoughi]
MTHWFTYKESRENRATIHNRETMQSALFVLLSCILLVNADCDCKESEDALDIFQFLRRLSTQDKVEKYPVVAGELAPLVPCPNCVGSRRKRSDSGLNRFQVYGCPKGFIRIGPGCIDGKRFGRI